MACACISLAAFAQSNFVYETPAELSLSSDFDADGREDIVIVDKVTGAYRLGYQTAPGVFTWANPRASGVAGASGMSAGLLLSTNRPALAVAGPEANRVNLLDASSVTNIAAPRPVFIPSLGPNLVIAIDIGGIGNDPFHDLFVGTIHNGAFPHRFNTLRNTGGTNFTLIENLGLASRIERGNRVSLKSGTADRVGVMFRDVTDTFFTYSLSSGALAPGANVALLPHPGDYVFGNFAAGQPLTKFLFYKPGETNLTLRPVQEPVPGTLNFGGATTFNFTQTIAQVLALPGASATKLLLIFGSGESASVLNFNGTNAPTLLQSFAAAAGENFTGAAALAANDFMFFSGAAGSRISTRFEMQDFNGSSYIPGASGALPPLTPFTGGANVLQFQREPFVSNDPNLLRLNNAGDWSSALTLTGTVSALVERFVNSTQGLDDPTLATFGPKHVLASAGLVNQYTGAISLFSFSAAIGDQVSDVKISPDPGTYKSSIQISFTTSDTNHQVYYRQNLSENWRLYSIAVPVRVFTNTTIYFYAKPVLGNDKSPIKSAAYQFVEPLGTRDSDGDGVPDYVEIAKGLDPVESGPDADGDGYSDLDELLHNYDPNSAVDHPPTNHARLELRASFDYVSTPRPWDGFSNRASLCLTGAIVRVYDLQGSLLASGIATNVATNAALPAVTNPAVRLAPIVYDTTHRLLVAGTELHYDIVTTNEDAIVGREMVSLICVPQIIPLTNSHVYSGGNITNEANAWIAAGSNAVASTTPALVQGDLSIFHTLTGLLVEREVVDILESRGWHTNITLFPHRVSDISRVPVPQPVLLALESRTTNGLPGFLLKQILTSIHSLVETPVNAAMQDLKSVTAEIYRISSACNNTSPGAFPSPVDVLRTFISSGVLHSNYLTKTNIAGTVLSNATNGVRDILAMVNGRPTTNILLRVKTNSFLGSCTTLETVGLTPVGINLFDSAGRPFAFPDAFNLLAGSMVQVFGYTDITNRACAGACMEVITNSVVAVPLASDPDANGNLLLDTWEHVFLGLLGGDAFGDHDGDGWQNLQEMFEGSDPDDPLGIPARAPVNLTPPLISIELLPNGDVRFRWSWPMDYVANIRFAIHSSQSVAGDFAPAVLDVANVSGQFDVTLSNPDAETAFYFVTMSLR